MNTIHLDVQLRDPLTTVTSTLTVRRGTAATAAGTPLRLDGDQHHLMITGMQVGRSVAELKTVQYTLDETGGLVLVPPAGFEDTFAVRVTAQTQPSANVSLDELYKSHGLYCTQCEAQAFRKIAYHLDRPDVLSVWTCRIEAGKEAHKSENCER